MPETMKDKICNVSMQNRSAESNISILESVSAWEGFFFYFLEEKKEETFH